jgi:hypothetical protein
MFLNLIKLNMSGVLADGPSGDHCFCELCPNLTSLTWNRAELSSLGVADCTCLDLRGSCFRMATSLRELYVEDLHFLNSTERDIDLMKQVEGDLWLFCECPTPLERIDLKGASYSVGVCIPQRIPQKALIKLVRRSPHLQWFRSDLSYENIAMLQLERPYLTFVST